MWGVTVGVAMKGRMGVIGCNVLYAQSMVLLLLLLSRSKRSCGRGGSCLIFCHHSKVSTGLHAKSTHRSSCSCRWNLVAMAMAAQL